MAERPQPGPIAQTLGMRLTLWYALIFGASTLLVAMMSYALLDRSLALRDREIIQVKLADYAARYDSSGVRGLSDAVVAEQASGSGDPVFVRLANRSAEVLLVSLPSAWGAYDLGRLDYTEGWRAVPARGATTELEVATEHLWDGTVLQVGRTTRDRERTLADVRALLGVVLVTVVLLGLAGGGALTWSAFRPIRDLLDTLREITRTGRLDARVPVGTHQDVLSDLGRVSNEMLDRIATLVSGMREALDAVAHDLRTPIARLRGRAEQALVGPPDIACYREALEDCVEEADRVSSLLTTLMDISEAESGVMQLSLEPVDVGTVLAETVDLYEDVAETRGVRVTATPPDPPVRVLADRPRLRQVLANLVDNAVKYTPSGGTVVLRAEARAGDVALDVRDTGPGIPPEQLPRIWERLYRGDAARHERGLGLGLSLVKAVVRAHGGRADVTSAPGDGSTFSITLPRAT